MKRNRPYHFGAGPAMLPESILQEVQSELLDWQGLGVSILEVGHRSEAFKALLEQAEEDLRQLLKIPAYYHVLFLGGAARTHFAMIPLNFLPPGKKAGYVWSGLWSGLAFNEASKINSNVYCATSSDIKEVVNFPSPSAWKVEKNTAYLYYTPNETVNGVQLHEPPDCGDIPLIADMTSCLLSEPINVSDYALIFAGAQKNIAAAGLTVVIIDEALIKNTQKNNLPSMLDYRIHAQHHSLYATPPVFNCYLAAKMFQWIKAKGGVEVLYQQNCLKANKLYQYIDSSFLYQCKVEKTARSIMNVCFSLAREELETVFLENAERQGLIALKGHRTQGGLRASLYNAMPIEGVDALIAFMRQFAKEHQYE